MRRDRKFDDDLGRKALIAAFDLVADPDLVSRTRRQMASILF
jgi:putative thioredoxin